jgi:type II secretory pathway component PulJ
MEGFTILETLLALMLATLVLGSLLMLTEGVTSAARQAQALEGLASTLRTAHAALAPVTAVAGGQVDPTTGTTPTAVAGSQPGPQSDILSLQTLSPRNCFDNDNPVREPGGAPAWWLQRNEFTVRDGWRLVRSCFYGPPGGGAIRQLNAATLVEGVEALRLRFALDTDGDRRLDRWVMAGAWPRETTVIGVRVGLVLATEQPVGATPGDALRLFGQPQIGPADGRARIAPTLTLPIRGRLR